MSTSIRQKITLFTLVPAVVFYSLVTAVYLYFTFHAASVEISHSHLEQSLRYASVIDGHLQEIHLAGKSLGLLLDQRLSSDLDVVPVSASELLGDARLVVGVGLTFPGQPARSRYWNKRADQFARGPDHYAVPGLPEVILQEFAVGQRTKPEWYVNRIASRQSVFRSTYMVPVLFRDGQFALLRIDIDGSLLTAPLIWSDPETRLVILDREGITVYANSKSLEKNRELRTFINSGPCDGYSQVNVTREDSGELVDFITRPIKAHSEKPPCAVFDEAFRRVTGKRQSINFRVEIRGVKKWVTATPIPSTGWYFSISILEDSILQPIVRQAVISVSLIALVLLLTMFCLWTVSGLITRPLNRLKSQMNEFASPSGQNSDDGYCDEAASLDYSFNMLLQRLRDRERLLQKARANNIGHLVQQLKGQYFYFNLDASGAVTYVSPSIKAILGYSEDAFAGQMQCFLSASSLNKVFSDKLATLVSGQWEEAFEVEMVHKDGSFRRVELFCTTHEKPVTVADASSLESGRTPVVIEGMANDITERINDTEKFRQLIASAPDATVICNDDGVIALVNRRVTELSGFKPSQLINMPLALLIAPDRRSEERLLAPVDPERPECHCVDEYLTEGITASGRRFPMEVSSNVLETAEGKLISIILRDVTERKRIESELVHAKVSAEQASQAKSLFLSNISHELRTPLNGVLGYAQLLLTDAEVPERYRDNLSSLEGCALHLMTLINDILDMTKIESSGVELDPQPYVLESMLDTVLANVRETARTKELTLDVDIDSGISPEIVGDSVKLRQVLINLMGNAVKFTDHGGVSLKVRKKQKKLCFSVVDTGLGISTVDQARLFKPFGQLKSGRSQGGTGLGLAISYRLVKAMGGELKVSSQLHRGSDFHFSIPYLPVSVEAGPTLEAASETMVVSGDYHGRRILVVDDSETNRDMLISALRSAGFVVEEAANGAEALEQCRISRFDLVLMDLKMPVLDGISATREIHEQPENQGLSIIAVSASVSESTRQSISRVGVCDFISKPVRFSELFSKVYRWVGEGGEIQPDSKNKTDYTDVPLAGIEMMLSGLSNYLDIGDIHSLNDLAQQWSTDKELGHYPDQIIQSCGALDLMGLERIREELQNRLKSKSYSGEVNGNE
ncbi:hypothetical protein GZ77_00720 [Endozoicomonas montiporae]|uniref:histidine kinase n=2 Tax=Endozoicomonas montiporae TaxID=1027273 RepID=A0A081N9W9_9GAMM|nr:PAS domain S-box protein [Endozoicomonas montiporae]AMO57094.1 carbohydrate kinase [Endozoicomonas montiporae CL-33]KEQ15242.1 hypothetical protein GZ77_00720 [Endozoicomonas montiporae]